MSNYDNDILIENISKLMKDNNITQAALAEILGMSQSNVSKALSTSDKKNFTLDQIVGIAKHFKVSIDSLVGNQSGKNRDVSPRAVAEYFVRLIEEDYIKIFEYPIEEDIYEEPDYNPSTDTLQTSFRQDTINYNAFYFPSYWHIPKDIDNESGYEMQCEIEQCGNATLHAQTNVFFHHFLKIYSIYKTKALDEDTYRAVVASLLNNLSDR